MRVVVMEPMVGYGAEIEMLAESIVAGKGNQQSGDHKTVTIGEFLSSHPEDCFLSRVTGESMTGAQIFQGDLMIVDRKKTPKSGDVIVVTIDGDTIVKRLHIRDGQIFLESENPLFKEYAVTEEMNFQIMGVVSCTIHTVK